MTQAYGTKQQLDNEVRLKAETRKMLNHLVFLQIMIIDHWKREIS